MCQNVAVWAYGVNTKTTAHNRIGWGRLCATGGHKKAPASGDTGARRVEFDGQGRALQMTNDADRLAGYGAGVKTSVRAHLCLQSASAVEEPAWCDCHASTSFRSSA